MRCPKCNYISFDEVEICGGCKKNIAKYSQTLHGVIFKAECPDFLWFQKPEEEPEEETEIIEEDAESDIAEVEEADTEIDMGFDDVESEGPASDDTVEFAPDAEETDLGLDLDTPDTDEEPQEIEFDLDAASPEVEAQKEDTQEVALDFKEDTKGSSLFDVDDAEDKGLADLSMDGLDDLDIQLDDAEEAALPSVTLDKTPEAKQPAKKKQVDKSPGLDDLDLSGLMPAAEEAPDISLDDIGELSLEKTETEPSKKGTEGDRADLLSDLSIDGLDLDAPILPPASSAAGKKMRPAAKTGTALDSFDIDLGNLLGGDEKNK